DTDTDDATYSPTPSQPAAEEPSPAQGQAGDEDAPSAVENNNSSSQPAPSDAPVQNSEAAPTGAQQQPESDNSQPAATQTPVSGEAGSRPSSSAQVENKDASPSSQSQTGRDLPPRTSSPATTAPSSQVPARRPATAALYDKAEDVYGVDIIKSRSSQRALAAQEDAAETAAYNRAVEVQRDRILRGLIDAMNPSTGQSNLLSHDSKEEPKQSLIEVYYAQA
ncbi:hypothetical protein, partial [Rhizobium sp. 22-785-1]